MLLLKNKYQLYTGKDNNSNKQNKKWSKQYINVFLINIQKIGVQHNKNIELFPFNEITILFVHHKHSSTYFKSINRLKL